MNGKYARVLKAASGVRKEIAPPVKTAGSLLAVEVGSDEESEVGSPEPAPVVDAGSESEPEESEPEPDEPEPDEPELEPDEPEPELPEPAEPAELEAVAAGREVTGWPALP